MAKKTPAANAIIPAERIQQCIYLIRGQKVLLDEDLAHLYGVQTRVLNQAVSRNADRFPEDFVFRPNAEEFANLKSQIVTSTRRADQTALPYPAANARTAPGTTSEVRLLQSQEGLTDREGNRGRVALFLSCFARLSDSWNEPLISTSSRERIGCRL